MAQGESDLNAGHYAASESAYKDAADMAAKFGDGNDKKVRALLGWLNALQRSGQDAAAINAVKEQVLSASLKHMEYLCDHGPKDFAEMIDLDAGVLNSLDPEKIDAATADSYTKELLDNARKAFQAQSYVKALSWLNQALRMEQQAHNNSGVAACAKEFISSGKDKQNATALHQLLERAEQAERADERTIQRIDERTVKNTDAYADEHTAKRTDEHRK
jgi:hypothetical protein